MKTESKAKLKSLSLPELIKLAQDKRRELMQASVNSRAGQHKNLKTGFKLRQEIAIINTFITQKKHNFQEPA